MSNIINLQITPNKTNGEKKCPFISGPINLPNPVTREIMTIIAMSACIKSECTFYNEETKECRLVELCKNLSFKNGEEKYVSMGSRT